MSAGEKRYPLPQAMLIAKAFARELEPACARIEIAGSLRRQVGTIGDIELVAIPRYDDPPPIVVPQANLFAPPEAAVQPAPALNLVWVAIERLGREAVIPIKPGTAEIEPDLRWAEKRTKGSKYFRLWLPRTQLRVDLFLADPATWGAIYTIRTGSVDFARGMVTRWTRLTGGHCQEGLLRHPDGRIEATHEEADFFRACRLMYTPPKFRGGVEDFLEPQGDV